MELGKESNQSQNRKFTRREFLGLLAGGVGGALAAYYGLDDSAGLAINAGLSRLKETTRLNDEEHEPSEEILEDTWRNYFQTKVNNQMTFEAWRVIGKSMGGFANLSYNVTKEKRGYDEYYGEYISTMEKACEVVGLDLELLTVSLDYSANALIKDVRSQRGDVVIGLVQSILGPLSNDLRIEDFVSEKFGVETLGLPIEGSQMPLSYGRAAQLLSANITTGIMDYELSEKARAIFEDEDGKASKYFKEKYPQLSDSFENLYKSYLLRKLARVRLGKFLEDNSEKLAVLLEPFFDEDAQSEAFADIGIGKSLSRWQKIQPTRTWQKIYYPGTKKPDAEISREVIEDYRRVYKSDRKRAVLALAKEQIRNPRFIEYIDQRGVEEGTISQLKKLVEELAVSKKRMVQSLYNSQRLEAEYEYDPEYQCLSAAALTKMLLEVSEARLGEFKKGSKDEVALYSYAISSVREMPKPHFLVDTRWPGLDLRVDAPYQRQATMADFAVFVEKVENFSGKSLRNDVSFADWYVLEKRGASKSLVDLAMYWNWRNSVNMGAVKYYSEKEDWLSFPQL